MALWLVVGGDCWVLENGGNNERTKFKSDSRILLVRSGADEQCGGYSGHKTKFKQGSSLLPKIQMTNFHACKIFTSKGNGRNDIYIVKSTMPKFHTATDKVEQPSTMNLEMKNAEQFWTSGPMKESIFILFLKQLTLLSPFKSGVRGLREQFSSNNTMDINNGHHQRRINGFWRSVWRFVLGLDITLKLPVLIMVPFYIGIRIIHGVEVTAELTPLWVLAPVAIAIYVKMFQWICWLYILSFNLIATVVKFTPGYLLLWVSYVSDGRLRSDIVRQISHIQGVDLRLIWRRSVEGAKDGVVGLWLDFVELIWPFYCRSVRFLKRASFI